MFYKSSMSPKIKLFLISVFSIVLLSLSTHSYCRDTIRIALIPEMNVFKQKARFKLLEDYLTEKLGIDIEITMMSAYGNIINRLQTEQVDAAFLGSFTGALSIMQLGVEPIVRPLNLDGTSTYHGHIFVRKDSNIESVEDMKDKVMAFVDKATTAGYIFPLAYIKRHGVRDHRQFFKEFFFTGSHDSAIEAVLSGKADIGAAKNTIFDFYMETHPEAKQELVILASSSNVPSNGLCVIPTLDDELKKRIKKVLLELDKDPNGGAVLNKLRAKRFIDTSKEDYQPVIDLAAEAGMNLSEYLYYNK